MTKLECIEKQLHESNIHVYNFRISNTKKAMCFDDSGYKCIAIDNVALESCAEQVTILAEELGHFETGTLYTIRSTYNTPIARSNRIKLEGLAKQWAIKRYLPAKDIETAMQDSLGDIHLAAENCQITVEFFNEAIEYYRSAGTAFSFDCDMEAL